MAVAVASSIARCRRPLKPHAERWRHCFPGAATHRGRKFTRVRPRAGEWFVARRLRRPVVAGTRRADHLSSLTASDGDGDAASPTPQHTQMVAPRRVVAIIHTAVHMSPCGSFSFSTKVCPGRTSFSLLAGEWRFVAGAFAVLAWQALVEPTTSQASRRATEMPLPYVLQYLHGTPQHRHCAAPFLACATLVVLLWCGCACGR